MGKPAKIRKKKSFMFTSKHQSFNGILGLVIAVCTLITGVLLVVYSYGQAGRVASDYGVIGLFVAILNLIGLIAGLIGIRERDVFITPSIISISANSVMLLAWAVLLFIANK